MKIENPRALAIIGVLIIAGIFFLSQGKNTPVSTQESTLLSSEMKENFSPAPELSGIAGYINTHEGFALNEVKGKVILVDFWTYSCINCIRTQPYLNAWHEKYADKGLVIVGVHSPEFAFEKEYENVLAAVEREGIAYPVVLDNDFSTWRAYQNQYWPRKYLIDADGFIRYDHVGEGAYEETEEMIQRLLKERDESIALGENVASSVSAEAAVVDFSKIKTPEIYLGYAFARAPLANAQGFLPEEEMEYALPETLPSNLAGLEGTWLSKPDYMELVSEYGGVALAYGAKNVNMVAAGDANVSVFWDGELVKTLSTSEETLYSVIEGNDYAEHMVVLDIQGKGFRLYTFTFG